MGPGRIGALRMPSSGLYGSLRETPPKRRGCDRSASSLGMGLGAEARWLEEWDGSNSSVAPELSSLNVMLGGWTACSRGSTQD
jgi:hypothetical protein